MSEKYNICLSFWPWKYQPFIGWKYDGLRFTKIRTLISKSDWHFWWALRQAPCFNFVDSALGIVATVMSWQFKRSQGILPQSWVSFYLSLKDERNKQIPNICAQSGIPPLVYYHVCCFTTGKFQLFGGNDFSAGKPLTNNKIQID